MLVSAGFGVLKPLRMCHVAALLTAAICICCQHTASDCAPVADHNQGGLGDPWRHVPAPGVLAADTTNCHVEGDRRTARAWQVHRRLEAGMTLECEQSVCAAYTLCGDTTWCSRAHTACDGNRPRARMLEHNCITLCSLLVCHVPWQWLGSFSMLCSVELSRPEHDEIVQACCAPSCCTSTCRSPLRKLPERRQGYFAIE